MDDSEEKVQAPDFDHGQINDGNNNTRSPQTPTEDMTSLQRTITITESLQEAPKRQLAIMVFVALTQMVQMYPYSAGITGAYSIATSFHYDSQESTQIIPESARKSIAGDAAWIAASYPLTQGTFVLMGGRMGDIYGHKVMLMGACAWWWIWQLACGFAPNLIALCCFRGLSGIGGGFITPNAVALLGLTFPPGKKRNLAMGLFGAMAPVGAAGGAMFVAILVQLTEWKWVFFFPTILGFVVFSLALISLPMNPPLHEHNGIDWIGSYLGVAGLILFNFAWK